MYKASLTYIYHDCFVYRSHEMIIVFDWWKTPLNNPLSSDNCHVDKMLLELAESESSIPVYVLVSHHHKDHFNLNIFSWHNIYPHITYIISDDVAKRSLHLWHKESIYKGKNKVPPEKVTILKSADEYTDSHLYVKAYPSTDIGNSYFLQTSTHSIFHAGDLNAWVWKDESTPQEIEMALRQFDGILEEIRSEHPHIDIVMFPVDGRIGKDWWEGAFRFLHKINTDLFIPMHFCLAENLQQQKEYIRKASNFALYANPERGKCALLTIPGQILAVK